MTDTPNDTSHAVDDAMNVLVLVSGTLTDGQSHYAYASIPLSKYEPFKQAEAAGNYDLAQFGKILEHGEGREPPEDVKKRMAEDYGVNHYFESDLQDIMARFNAEVKD